METEYISRCLRELYNFANDLQCHVQVLAHPSKMDSSRRYKPPELEDISGLKAWDAMADQGFVVYRQKLFNGTERQTTATLYHLKARIDELGHPCKLPINYSLADGRFRPATEVEAAAAEELPADVDDFAT